METEAPRDVQVACRKKKEVPFFSLQSHQKGYRHWSSSTGCCRGVLSYNKEHASAADLPRSLHTSEAGPARTCTPQQQARPEVCTAQTQQQAERVCVPPLQAHVLDCPADPKGFWDAPGYKKGHNCTRAKASVQAHFRIHG